MFDVGTHLNKAMNGWHKRERAFNRHWRKWDKLVGNDPSKEGLRAGWHAAGDEAPEELRLMERALKLEGIKAGDWSLGDEKEGRPPMIEAHESIETVQAWIEAKGAGDMVVALPLPDQDGRCVIVPTCALDAEPGDWTNKQAMGQIGAGASLALGRKIDQPDAADDGRPVLSDLDDAQEMDMSDPSVEREGVTL